MFKYMPLNKPSCYVIKYNICNLLDEDVNCKVYTVNCASSHQNNSPGYHLSWIPHLLYTTSPGYNFSWIPPLQDNPSPGYHFSCIPLLLDTISPGYHFSWIPPLLGTTSPGYHLSWIRFLLDTTSPVYNFSWIPPLLDNTSPGYHFSWIPLLLDTTSPGYHFSWIPLLLYTTSPGYDFSWFGAVQCVQCAISPAVVLNYNLHHRNFEQSATMLLAFSKYHFTTFTLTFVSSTMTWKTDKSCTCRINLLFVRN